VGLRYYEWEMEGGREGVRKQGWGGCLNEKGGRELIWGHKDGLSTAELFELHIWGGREDSWSFTLIPLTQSHQKLDWGTHLRRTKPPLTKSLWFSVPQPHDRLMQHVTQPFQYFTEITCVKYSLRSKGHIYSCW